MTPGTPPAAPASLSLLGSFEVRLDGQRVGVPFSAQRVVAFLGLHPGRRTRVFVAGHLWMDIGEDRAAASLRTALWRLGLPSSRLVCCDGRSISLRSAVEVDVDACTRVARVLLDDETAPIPSGALARLRDAGDVLPDWYDDWVLIERERHRQLRLHALECLSARLSAGGRHAAATEAGLAAIAGEPLRESAHRTLISAHLAEGNRGEALRQYRVCCGLLDRDLKIGPSPALQSLIAPLLEAGAFLDTAVRALL